MELPRTHGRPKCLGRVTGYLLVLHLLVVQALVPLPCGQMLVGQKLVVTIACEVICLQFSLLVSNMLVAVICL